MAPRARPHHGAARHARGRRNGLRKCEQPLQAPACLRLCNAHTGSASRSDGSTCTCYDVQNDRAAMLFALRTAPVLSRPGGSRAGSPRSATHSQHWCLAKRALRMIERDALSRGARGKVNEDGRWRGFADRVCRLWPQGPRRHAAYPGRLCAAVACLEIFQQQDAFLLQGSRRAWPAQRT